MISFFDDLGAAKSTISRSSASWQIRNETSEWCYRDTGSNNQHPGLLFVKVPKTASSTLAGINVRIARKIGKRTMSKRSFFFKKNAICAHTVTHGRDLLVQKWPNQLMWSFVRDPAARALSAFFHFQVSRKGVWPTMGHLINYMSEESCNFQFLYLSTHSNPKRHLKLHQKAHDNPSTLIHQYVLQKYDFLGIVDRWTESLAAMVLLWNLKVEDVIVLPSKLAGGYDDGRYQNAGCVKIHEGSIGDKSYFDSYLNTTFRQQNLLDYKLYELANQRLTSTIQKLGVERVGQVQQTIEMYQKVAEAQCLSSAIFPCSSNGTWQYGKSKYDCYWFDSGCGYSCIDQVLPPPGANRK